MNHDYIYDRSIYVQIVDICFKLMMFFKLCCYYLFSVCLIAMPIVFDKSSSKVNLKLRYQRNKECSISCKIICLFCICNIIWLG